jgi:NitT/TauT family transport system ATP-binding protein
MASTNSEPTAQAADQPQGGAETVNDDGYSIEIDRLHKSFTTPDADLVVIDDVSLRVPNGQFVSVVGPSGCGKTTLLRCVIGLETPNSGEVRHLGHPVAGPPSGMAVVFQDYSRSLFPWMNVARNLDLPLRAIGVDKADRQERISEVLEMVGLGGLGKRYPWQLSGGMQQRIAIARALVVRPRTLVMDEPFAAVDAQTRMELQSLVLDLWTELEFTALFVTHDIDEAVFLADRVVVMTKAKIQDDMSVSVARPRDHHSTKRDSGFIELRDLIYSKMTSRSG